MKRIIILISVLAIAVSTTGCSSMYNSQYAREEIQADSSAMSIDDVVRLSSQGIGDEVIISQIKATNSYFELTSEDIVGLKKEGVSEKVINVMIKTKENAMLSRNGKQYYGYSTYRYPWYSSFSLGLFGGRFGHFPSYGGYSNRSYFPGGRMGMRSGGHSSGGHRSSGRRR